MFETIHPVIVHFPIALLVTYSILEIASLIGRIRHNQNIRYIKLFLVVVGWLFVQLALSSGEAAADAGNGVKVIIEWHEIFANASTWIYGIVAIAYILKWYLIDLQTTVWGMKISATPLHTLIVKLNSFLSNYYILLILAVLGMGALSITGTLGGAMVYGPNYDPMTIFVTQTLNIGN